MELSFERIDQKALSIKTTGLETLGLDDDIFQKSVEYWSKFSDYEAELEREKTAMRKRLLGEVVLPESLKAEEADKIYERYVANLTEFASKLWLDYSPEDRQGLLVI